MVAFLLFSNHIKFLCKTESLRKEEKIRLAYFFTSRVDFINFCAQFFFALQKNKLLLAQNICKIGQITEKIWCYCADLNLMFQTLRFCSNASKIKWQFFVKMFCTHIFLLGAQSWWNRSQLDDFFRKKMTSHSKNVFNVFFSHWIQFYKGCKVLLKYNIHNNKHFWLYKLLCVK